MSNRIKVRFHLAAGEHHMQWQVKMGQSVSYFEPDKFCLVMKGCRLRNHETVAKRIHSGDNKAVCAWVECEEVEFFPAAAGEYFGLENGKSLRYNPRFAPYWVDGQGHNVDDSKYPVIYSRGRGLVHG